jgi:hypothetical protein
MNQDIDLLAAVSADRQHLPTGLQAAVFLAVTIAVAVVSGRWLDGRVEAAEREIVTLNAALDDLVFGLEERSQFLVDRNADQRLLDQLAELERELADKTQVLNLLSGETLGNTQGFAGQLAALGRRHPSGLWLQRILVADGGRRLELRGQALEAQLLPNFLDALQNESVLSGMAFETVALSTDPTGMSDIVDFVLATGCEDAQGGSPDACLSESTLSPRAAESLEIPESSKTPDIAK